MFLLLSALLAGMLTVLAPCILPMLPLIIGGSVTGDVTDKKRPLVIALSLAVSLIAFTLLLKATTIFITVPPQTIAAVSGIIIILLGVALLFPLLYAQVIAKFGIEHRSVGLLSKGTQRRGLLGPIITGAALGPVFSSCSPVYAYILATVLPVNFGQAFAYIIAYVAGLSLVLLLIGYYGQRFVRRIRFAANPKGTFQRVVAILFIAVGLLVATGYDKRLQTWVSRHTPFNFDALSSQLLPDSKNKVDNSKLYNAQAYPAPEFTGVEDWINSKPLTMKGLKGKVVLVDFWTYSCINCIRNNPYIEKWYQAYKDDGLVVVGVHAPEFAFEKVPANVKRAVKDQKLTYPVVLDNDFATWNAYDNRSWPASYLVDVDGNVRRIHEGEGKYKESEEAIRGLLEESGARLGSSQAADAVLPISAAQTRETYLGFSRASNFAGSATLAPARTETFILPVTLAPNDWALGGKWQTTDEHITSRSDAALRFNVSAKDVYLVASPEGNGSKTITVKVNGKKTETLTVDEAKLYQIAAFTSFTHNAVIELVVPAGVTMNAFTFGS